MTFENSLEFAKRMDEEDELKKFRESFYIPIINGKECIYFTGNSLGLEPKTTQDYIYHELESWANFAVEAHFNAKIPWAEYHDTLTESLSKIIGCKREEVVVMNSLSVNLHLLLATFYQPTNECYKILCEAKAFPSDQYVMETQARFHGYDPGEAIIEVSSQNGYSHTTTEDIISAIEHNKNELALVLVGGINYYTGRVFDMKAIAEAAHKAGARCGFDLAHAAGNIELHMHDWDVDFACWCSYKYLNSGPGGIAGVYIHERFIKDTSLPRLAGWWGYEKETRFKMEKGFKPIPTAEGWQLSNGPVLLMAAHKAALDIFDEAGMERIIKKSKRLTGYLLFILEEINKTFSEKMFEVITPQNEIERGCQLSLMMLHNGKEVFQALRPHGVIADWREPDVIRVSPVPLYNTFTDIYQFGKILIHLLQKQNVQA